jgi:hypothetical protein
MSEKVSQKRSEGEVWFDYYGNLFVWPIEQCYISKEQLSMIKNVEIGLVETLKHNDAYAFFMPLALHLAQRGIIVKITLGPRDLGLVHMGLDKLHYVCTGLCLPFFAPRNTRIIIDDSADLNISYVNYLLDRSSDLSFLEYANKWLDTLFEPEVSLLLQCKIDDSGEIRSQFGDYSSYSRYKCSSIVLLTDSAIFIGEHEYNRKIGNVLFAVDLRQSEADRLILDTKKCNFDVDLLLRSENDKLFRGDVPGNRLVIGKSPTCLWRSRTRYRVMVDICMALGFLNRPYVINDIVSWLDEFKYITQYERIAIIEPVFASMRKVWQRKEEYEKEIKLST